MMVQLHPQPNHHPAHDQRAQDAQEKDAMLEFLRRPEISKEQRDDKDVVHREREFDDIACNELKGALPLPARNRGRRQDQAEAEGQDKPDRRPRQRLSEMDDARLPVKNAEVERQEQQHSHNEDEPVEEWSGGGRGGWGGWGGGLGGVVCTPSVKGVVFFMGFFFF